MALFHADMKLVIFIFFFMQHEIFWLKLKHTTLHHINIETWYTFFFSKINLADHYYNSHWNTFHHDAMTSFNLWWLEQACFWRADDWLSRRVWCFRYAGVVTHRLTWHVTVSTVQTEVIEMCDIWTHHRGGARTLHLFGGVSVYKGVQVRLDATYLSQNLNVMYNIFMIGAAC